MDNLKRSSQKINAHLNAAKSYAELSRARRLKVGAVIVRDDRVISVGYNGTTTGQDNNCEDENGYTLPSVVHAESNSILFAAKVGTSTENATLITTHSPCHECAKMIIQCGIKEVYYETDYRDLSAVEFLRECNINVVKVGLNE